MKRKSSFFLILLIIILTASSAIAQGPGKEITGRVIGNAGDPKGFAGVTFNGARRYVSMTNSVGEFRLKNVEKGQYTVTVSQSNKVQRFMVEIDGSTTLDLKVGW